MKLLLRVFVSLFFSSALFAQTGTLRGIVTDESGAIVPGAKITLTASAGTATTALAGDDGSYSFTGIVSGDYVAEASAPDLATAPLKLIIRPGVQTLNLQLKVASLVQQVTVEDRAVTVTPEPANNASATVLAGDDLQALSENPDDLIAELIALAGPSAGPGGASVFIDGFSTGQLASKESIREIRINQNPFSAEYDRVGTGRVEILTRPGTNQFHGSATFNFSNDFWNSRNPYAQQKAPFLLREYRGNLSGPIGKRASFFLDLRRDATDNGAIINGTTLDPVALNIVDPFTDVFRIPQRRFSINPRTDYQLSANNTLTVQYGFTHVDIPSAGVGGFNLISRGARTTTTAHTVQVTETAVFAENMVNEIRFQFFRPSNQITPNTVGPTIQVLGAFNGGAAPAGHSFDTQNNHEFQDYVTVVHGPHSWRFGVRLRRQADDNISPQNFKGTFTFSGGASQFSIIAGDPGLAVSQFDLGIFISDDWKITRALTMSLGFRYEAQTNIGDRHDLAPRAGIAWALAPKTVARAGFGIFYDRFGLPNTMTALRRNGIRQQQYILTNPDFFPSPPSVSSLAGFQSMQVREQVSPTLVAPRFIN